jgi:hypothetical protein
LITEELIKNARAHLTRARTHIEMWSGSPKIELARFEHIISKMMEAEHPTSRTDILDKIESGLTDEILDAMRKMHPFVMARRAITHARIHRNDPRLLKVFLKMFDRECRRIARSDESLAYPTILKRIEPGLTKRKLDPLRRIAGMQ